MKITCNREQLLNAFQTVAAVAPARSPKPILQNVKLEVSDGNQATLQATDLEVAIRHVVEGVEVESAGSVLLPVSRFSSILRESSDETFRMEVKDSKTIIRGERSTFTLSSESADEFPPISAFEESACHEIPAGLLKEMIKRTIFATDNDSSRYALGGVKIEQDGESLLAIGTDGRRLAKMQGTITSSEGAAPFGDATIIPGRSLNLIDRVLTDDSATVKLAVRQNEVLIGSPTATLSTRLLEGRFPRWRDVFPQRSDSAKVELTVGPFFAAVRQAAIVTSEDSRGVNFTFGEGMLVLAGRASEVGDSRVELPISYEGEPITISLDPKYMADFLKTLDADRSFTIDLADGDSAAVASVDDGYGYVIMPLAQDRA